MAKLESKQLDLIDEDTRYSIANALRSAANRYAEAAELHGIKGTGADDTFRAQAAEALEWAEAFENC